MDLCLSGCSRAYNIYLKYQNLHIDNSENTGTLLLYSSIHSSPFYIIIIIIIEVDKREIHFYHYINLLIYPLLFSSLFCRCTPHTASLSDSNTAFVSTGFLCSQIYFISGCHRLNNMHAVLCSYFKVSQKNQGEAHSYIIFYIDENCVYQ